MKPSAPPPPPDLDHPHLIARNARYGLILFAIYVVFYAGFVALSAFGLEKMKIDIAGVNLAIVYGLGLIALAFVMAIIYMLICGKHNDGLGDGPNDGEDRE
jgi:uncharacterized membrane protein (DUF485 family)